MKRIASYLVAAPTWCLVVALAITAVFACQLPKLRVNVSPHMLMVGSDPAVAFYQETKERFGADELTILVYKADDVFTESVLESIARMSDRVRDIAEVVRVDSLATVNNIRADGGFVTTGKLIHGKDFADPADVAQIKSDALRNPIFVGKIVAENARTAAILVYSESDSDDLEFSKRFSSEVDALVNSEIERTGLSIYQVGRPYRQAMQGDTLMHDQTMIWPWGGLVIVVVLAVIFRSPTPVIITMIARLTTIVWAVGLMSAFGYPVTMLSVIIPILLISVGFTEDVHIISEYRHRIAEGLDKRAAIRETMENLATPLLVTSLTTAVGFASLSLSHITILHQLGVIATLGFGASFVVTFLVVPALLRFAPTPRIRDAESGEPEANSRLLKVLLAVSSASIRHRRWLLGAAMCVFAVTAVGLPRIDVDNDIMGFFRRSSEIRVRVQDIHENLAGVPIFYVVVDTGQENGMLEPQALRSVRGLQEFLADTGKIDETVSVTDFMMTVNREMNGGADDRYELPDSAQLAAQYLLMVHAPDVEPYIDFDNSAANVLVRHNISSTRDMTRLLDQIDAYAQEHMPFLKVQPTSETILTTRAADELAMNMLAGMAFTILIVAIVCALFFMSFYAALLSLLPNLLPIAVVFGVIGWFDIAINVGTSMVAAIAIGIAVDDTIHYMSRNSIELDRHHDPNLAMIATINAEGRVIVATSVALAGGFLVFMLSSFVPLAYFGMLAAITMLVALACDLTLTPALMASTRLVTLWNVVGMKLGGDICEIAPLFRGLTRWEARKLVLLGQLRQSRPGERLVVQGERDDGRLYVLLQGRLRVARKAGTGARVFAVLEPGDVFGEMSVIDGRERSADVVSDGDSEVLVLRADDLRSLERRFPRVALKIYRNLSRILSERLREPVTRDAENEPIATAGRV